jgi:hypothetical protein
MNYHQVITAVLEEATLKTEAEPALETRRIIFRYVQQKESKQSDLKSYRI